MLIDPNNINMSDQIPVNGRYYEHHDYQECYGCGREKWTDVVAVDPIIRLCSACRLSEKTMTRERVANAIFLSELSAVCANDESWRHYYAAALAAIANDIADPVPARAYLTEVAA